MRYYTLAGDAALARYANVEAVAAFTHALACGERAQAAPVDWRHLFTARGRALELNAQYSEALRNYEAMAERAAALGDRRLSLAASVACTQLYATSTPLFDPPKAERLSEASLAEAHALSDEAAEATILWNQLNLYRFTQRNRQARQVGERSLEIAQRLDLKGQAALTIHDLIHVYADLGLWPEAHRAFEEASRRWREMGNVAMLADCLSTMSLYWSLLGELRPALGLSQEAHELSLTIGNLWGQSYSLSGMGWPYWFLGHPDKAIQTTEECIQVGQAAGYVVVNVLDRARLAYLYGELGAVDRGLELTQQALQSTEFTGGVGLATILSVRIHLLLRSAQAEAAAAALNTLEGEMKAPPIWEVDALLRARSEMALAGDDAAHALEVTQAHVAGLREQGLAGYLPEALTRLAQAWLRLGRVAEARQNIRAGLDLVQDTGAVMIEWTLLQALGKLEAEHGDPAEAEPHWNRARDILRGIVGHIPTPELRASFLARPDVRELWAGSPMAGPGRSPTPAQPAL